jgi:hypothetical protein
MHAPCLFGHYFSTHENTMMGGSIASEMQKVEEKFVGIEKKCVTLPARLQKHYHNY